MTTKYQSHDNIFLKELKESPSFAKEYLTEVQQEGDVEVTIMAIREILTAYRLVKKMADSIGMSRSSLYNWLNLESEPYADTLQKSVNFINSYLEEKEIESYLFQQEFDISMDLKSPSIWSDSPRMDDDATTQKNPLAA